MLQLHGFYLLAARDDSRKAVPKPQDLVMLKLEAYLITDEPRTDRHDLLKHCEIILPQCIARLDDVEDDIA